MSIAVTMACGVTAFSQSVTVATEPAGATTTTTTSAGTISDFSPDTIVIRSEGSPDPVRYSYTKSTTYVDEAGAPVSMETVRSGLPVTVHYVRDGDRLVASRVVVRRHVAAVAPVVVEKSVSAPVVVEERRVVTPAPVIEEKRTTTTTTTTSGR